MPFNYIIIEATKMFLDMIYHFILRISTYFWLTDYVKMEFYDSYIKTT